MKALQPVADVRGVGGGVDFQPALARVCVSIFVSLILLVLPVAVWLFRRSRRNGIVWVLAIWGGGVAIGLLALWAGAGRWGCGDRIYSKDGSCCLEAPWTSNLDYNFEVSSVVGLCGCSIIADVMVVYYHVMYPPHPKFMLLPWRRMAILIHVLAGVAGICLLVIAFFVPEPANYVRAAAVTDALHCMTAAHMTPNVFGVQLVMVPVYMLLVMLKSALGVMAFAYPELFHWALRLFLVHHVYTWVRVFYSIFYRLGVVHSHIYTVSILLAGFAMLSPALGATFPLFVMAFVFCVAQVAKSILVGDAGWRDEKSIELFADAKSYRRLMESIIKNSPPGLREKLDECSNSPYKRSEIIYKVLQEQDKLDERDGIPISSTIGRLEQWGVSEATIKSLCALRNKGHEALDLAMFHRHVTGGVVAAAAAAPLAQNDGTLPHRRCPLFTVEERQQQHSPLLLSSEPSDSQRHLAKVVFDIIDSDGSGTISAHEIGGLLIAWGMSSGEVEVLFEHRYRGDLQHEIEFDEFLQKYRPVWLAGHASLANSVKIHGGLWP